MKVVIFSDSHGNVANMEDAVRLESPDYILHLGDIARDAEALAQKFPHIPIAYVPGNCDGFRPDLEELRIITLEGCKILMTHGHLYHVKLGMGGAVRAAHEAGVQMLCFGHTHEDYCKYENGLWVVNPGSIGSYGRHTYGVAALEDGGAVCYLSHL